MISARIMELTARIPELSEDILRSPEAGLRPLQNQITLP